MAICRDTHFAAMMSRNSRETLTLRAWFPLFCSWLVARLETNFSVTYSANVTIVQRADQLRQLKTGVLRGHLGSCVAICVLDGDVECFFAIWLCLWNLITVSNYNAGMLNR